MELPDWLLTHRVVVEPHRGSSAHGPAFGTPVEVPAFVDANTRTVRAPDGREAVSGTTVYVRLGARVRVGDRLTVNGTPVRVIDVKVRDGGGLPTPDHIEIVCE